MIPLLKAGKPAERVDSYRPVSLTSCLAKTMERLVANRLGYMAEARHWICDDQAGFRRMRSCEDQVLRLSQGISDGFQASPPQRTVLALLDYSKAYDTVWREKLFAEMMDKGVPPRYVRWCAAFLRNRLARVRFNGVESKFHLLRQGLPQGAVLSPLLFLFFVDGVRQVLPRELSVSMYDIFMWRSQ